MEKIIQLYHTKRHIKTSNKAFKKLKYTKVLTSSGSFSYTLPHCPFGKFAEVGSERCNKCKFQVENNKKRKYVVCCYTEE